MAIPYGTQSWLDDESRPRFWDKVDKSGPFPDATDPRVTAPASRCWVWTGAVSGTYGSFTARPPRAGKTSVAHRLSLLESGVEIPDGYQVDHLCRNRLCVNPEHLEAVTPGENQRRGDTFAAAHSRVTRCPWGHDYTAENTRVDKAGRRNCKSCSNERTREFRRALRNIVI